MATMRTDVSTTSIDVPTLFEDGTGTDSPVDLGDLTLSLSQLTGRLALAALAATIAVRLTRRLVAQVDDIRLREQLEFFAPKTTAVVVTIVSLSGVGIDLTGMAAVLATVGFTGAVVFTPVGQNLVAGAMIHMDDVYRVGEVVTVNDDQGRDLYGVVRYRSMLRTEMELPDGATAWVPNSLFQEHRVLNHSRSGAWRIDVEVPVDRIEHRERAVETMERVAGSLTWTVPRRQPLVAFDHVGGEAIVFRVFVWVDDRTHEPALRSRLLTALVDELEAEGISVGRTTQLAWQSALR